MPGTFALDVVTPAQLVYQGEVASLQAPGIDGYFGVLHNRAPLIAALGPGQVKFEEAGGATRYVAITGGFFQVVKNRAVVLADEAVFAAEIDRAAAEARLEEARQHLQGIMSEAERARWQRAAEVARTQIKVAGQVRK